MQLNFNTKIRNFIKNQRILIALMVFCIIIQIFVPNFLSITNIQIILIGISVETFILIGLAYLLILGEIDLSVGAVMSISATFSILFQPYGVFAGLISGIVVGLFIGFINGLIVAKLKVSSIPATLAMMIFINGLVYVLTKNTSIWGKNTNFNLLANFEVLGVPLLIILPIILIIIFDLILKKTVYGRYIYAIGGNQAACLYVGINVTRIKISAFILTGGLSGLAGVFLASKFNVASGLIGTQTALLVITAVLLGGVSLSGGEGSVSKAYRGLLIMGVLSNAMQLLKLPSPLQLIIIGSLLIFILVVDTIERNKLQYKRV